MDCRKFYIITFICIFSISSYLANGRDLYEHDVKKAESEANNLIPAMVGLSESFDRRILASQHDAGHFAVIRTVRNVGDVFYGAQATLNVYGLPSVANTQFSSADIQVINQNFGNVNAIQAGWHVQPELYGDHDTHFYVKWHVDFFEKTGCYNLNCEGFKLDSTSHVVPGAKVWPLSTYNGDQYEITLKISKNLKTGDWWLYYGYADGMKPVGYWPKSLFTLLAESSNYIWIGGIVAYNKSETSPPMGSGHFPNEGSRKAAFISDVQFINQNGSLYKPSDDAYELKQSSRNCYVIARSSNSKDTFYFGGPGGCKEE